MLILLGGTIVVIWHPSACLSICLFVHPSVCPSVHSIRQPSLSWFKLERGNQSPKDSEWSVVPLHALRLLLILLLFLFLFLLLLLLLLLLSSYFPS